MGSLCMSDMHLNIPTCRPTHFPPVCHRSLRGSSDTLARHDSTASLGVHLFAPWLVKACAVSSDLSSDDSDDRNRACPPTPPPRRFLKSGGSFRLPCLTKQASHEKPMLAPAEEQEQPQSDQNLMSRIAASLRFSPLPALAVVGVTPEQDFPAPSYPERQNNAAMHRASYHGHSKYEPEVNGIEVPNHMQKYNPEDKVIGSAENLVGRILQEQGLGRYCDPEFVKATQRELAEAINLSPEELDRAAHRLLQAERHSSNPYLYQPCNDQNHVPKLEQNASFLMSLEHENERPHSQQNYRTDNQWDKNKVGDTRL